MLDAEDKAALHTPDGGVAEPVPFRDDEGYINPDFIAAVADAIEESDTARLQTLVEDFHESDLGDLLEALDPEFRPRLIELLGSAFDFTALTEVDEAIREEILEGLNTSTLAEGVRDLDSDDAVTILESLAEEDKAEVLD
jgi:magnesium transporter